MSRHQIESTVRTEYNKYKGTNAKKTILNIGIGCGTASHEFDLYEQNVIIGCISTSSWFNETGTNNTDGQDQASSELSWLSLWQGNESRVHILTDKEMAHRLFKKHSGTPFPHSIEIHHFDINTKKFSLIGTL